MDPNIHSTMESAIEIKLMIVEGRSDRGGSCHQVKCAWRSPGVLECRSGISSQAARSETSGDFKGPERRREESHKYDMAERARVEQARLCTPLDLQPTQAE